jgi:hypothetical protein
VFGLYLCVRTHGDNYIFVRGMKIACELQDAIWTMVAVCEDDHPGLDDCRRAAGGQWTVGEPIDGQVTFCTHIGNGQLCNSVTKIADLDPDLQTCIQHPIVTTHRVKFRLDATLSTIRHLLLRSSQVHLLLRSSQVHTKHNKQVCLLQTHDNLN